MMNRRAPQSAFTLVEIALAVGVIAFSLTAIVGLLVSALGSSKESTDDTLIAAMTKSVVSDLRQKPFTSVLSLAALTSPTIYFDGGGNRLLDSSGADLTSAATALNAGAIYQCTEIFSPDANTMSANATQKVNLMHIQFTFKWPVTAASTTKNSKIMYASVANY